jgi:hypothetical protein
MSKPPCGCGIDRTLWKKTWHPKRKQYYMKCVQCGRFIGWLATTKAPATETKKRKVK